MFRKLPVKLFGTLIPALFYVSAAFPTRFAAADELTYAEFKKVCQDCLAKKSVPYVEVRIDIRGNKIAANVELVVAPSMMMGDTQQNPIATLRETQVGIEALRNFANKLERRKAFWGPYLNTAEVVMASALGELQKPQLNLDEKTRLAEQTQHKVVRLFGRAIQTYAKANGLHQVAEAPAPPMVHFKVEARPSDRTVELILEGDYILWKHGILGAGTASIDDSMLWKPLPPDEVSTYGVFYYRLVRTENGKKVSDRFDLRRKRDITTPQETIVFD